VGDVVERARQNRAGCHRVRVLLEIALPGHRADPNGVVRDANPGQAGHDVEVDQRARPR
jgi:hypothetical protein